MSSLKLLTNNLHSRTKFFLALFLLQFSLAALGTKELFTNQVIFHNAPDWLTESLLQQTVDSTQSFLEWDLKRVSAYGYSDAAVFNREHSLKFQVNAVFRRSDNSIHLSPKVTPTDFKNVFSHELVHAILSQKYKSAVPIWLEEGLANYIGKYRSPDYKALAGKNWPDVTQLGHPSDGRVDPVLHYAISTGLIEMIASKCSLKDLLQLSVGSKLIHYLKTYCEIDNLNEAFKKWVLKKSH